jgi:hypothetical protein
VRRGAIIRTKIVSALGLGAALFVIAAATALASHPRPQGAAALRVPLVLAYEECGDDEAPNRTHGPALSFPSCNPATQTSSWLTVGTMDANGFAPQSVASVQINVCPNGTTPSGACSTPSGMSSPDVRVAGSATDVRCKVGSPTQSQCEGGAFSDYIGRMRSDATIRITDHHNSVTAGGTGDTATVIDIPFPIEWDCVANPAGASPSSIGGTCNVSSSFAVSMPGSIQPTKRGNVELEQVQLFDGGADGFLGTTDNTLFAVQGIFIP